MKSWFLSQWCRQLGCVGRVNRGRSQEFLQFPYSVRSGWLQHIRREDSPGAWGGEDQDFKPCGLSTEKAVESKKATNIVGSASPEGGVKSIA